jgi:hypothetical protein
MSTLIGRYLNSLKLNVVFNIPFPVALQGVQKKLKENSMMIKYRLRYNNKPLVVMLNQQKFTN